MKTVMIHINGLVVFDIEKRPEHSKSKFISSKNPNRIYKVVEIDGIPLRGESRKDKLLLHIPDLFTNYADESIIKDMIMKIAEKFRKIVAKDGLILGEPEFHGGITYGISEAIPTVECSQRENTTEIETVREDFARILADLPNHIKRITELERKIAELEKKVTA